MWHWVRQQTGLTEDYLDCKELQFAKKAMVDFGFKGLPSDLDKGYDTSFSLKKLCSIQIEQLNEGKKGKV